MGEATDSSARRRALLAALERRTDGPLTALSIALVCVLLAPYVLDPSGRVRAALSAANIAIWAVFALDLAAKLTIAPERRSFLRHHWIDVLLVALPMLRPLRALRAVRVARVAVASGRSLGGIRRMVARTGLHQVAAVAIVAVLAAAVAVVEAERGSEDASIRTFGDGLWWATTTITTVGYGDEYPITTVGRVIAVALMVVGIGVFGTVAAGLAAYLVEERDTDDDAVLAALRRVEERLAAIERRLDEGNR